MIRPLVKKEGLLERIRRARPFGGERTEERKVRLKIELELGELVHKGINSDFYTKVMGPILREEREKAIKEVSRPVPESSRERASAKLEFVEHLMSKMQDIIERGNKAGRTLEEIRKKENGE